MSSLDKPLQRHQPIQLFAIAIAQRRLTNHALVALLLHHKVAAIIPFGEDGRDERGVSHRQGTGLRVGDVRCPDRDEHAEMEVVVHFCVPQLHLGVSVSGWLKVNRTDWWRGTHAEGTGVIFDGELQTSLRCVRHLARCWYVVEIDHPSHQRYAAWASD